MSEVAGDIGAPVDGVRGHGVKTAVFQKHFGMKRKVTAGTAFTLRP